MPNTLGTGGLTIKTRAELLDEMLNGTDGYPGLYQIYGADINVDPNTPDGNLLNLIAQIAIDYLEFLQQVYTSFDPDQAIGTSLDLRCAINGVVRQAGTRTTQLVTVTATQAVTIDGLDTAPDAPFTITDATGNRFNLLATHAFGAAGSTNLTFQAEEIGAILVSDNTLTEIATPTLGISTVTNGTLDGTTGVNEETDLALRIRRTKSVSLPSQGYLEGLLGALLAVQDTTDARILENVTNATDGNGVPAHSIWCIVAGGLDAAVALAIYNKRNAGCGMKGAVAVDVDQADGSTFEVLFDRPIAEDLWISFDLVAKTGSVDATYVRAQILLTLGYRIGQAAEASEITAMVKTFAENCYVEDMGVSNADASYIAYQETTGVNYKWALAAARIKINGAVG